MPFLKVEPDAVIVARTDPDDPLSSYAPFAFDLDDGHWPSVEHYYQAMRFADPDDRAPILATRDPAAAATIARKRRRAARPDWDSVKEVFMTRGTYIKCRSHAAVADALLATGERQIIENSQYDYFWGCGRDTRGRNAFGNLLMAVRARLREERAS